jgi:hypothetical protein
MSRVRLGAMDLSLLDAVVCYAAWLTSSIGSMSALRGPN